MRDGKTRKRVSAAGAPPLQERLKLAIEEREHAPDAYELKL